MRKPAILLGMLLCVAPAARAQRPVCIVNGVRVANGGSTPGGTPLRLGDADPSTIEHIEVIKGAAAVKQYGPEASNGVISITTKKGAADSQNWSSICGAPGQRDADPFGKYLYPPELVMAHEEAIGLTDRQRTAIAEAVKDVQSKATDAQFKLAAVTEKFTRLLASATVDEASVLQQIDQMLSFEREVKRAQITLLVRIKNQLTAEQQGMLDKFR